MNGRYHLSSDMIDKSQRKKNVKTPKNRKRLVLLHGTSRKRAENIIKNGFADTSKLSREMREGWGSVGEQDLTFFVRYYGFKEKSEKERIESGALHHAVRVADMDKDLPAIILARASVKKLVDDKDWTWFNPELKRFAMQKVESGDQRYFRWYSIEKFDNSVLSAVASVGTENLSMGEILRSMNVDAIMDGKSVVVLPTPNHVITSMEIMTPDQFCAWSGFTGTKYSQQYKLSEEKEEECGR